MKLKMIFSAISKTAGNAGTFHRNKLACLLHKLATSIEGEYPRQSGSLKTPQNLQEQQKELMSDRQDVVANHTRKVPWPLKSSERKYEYLSLILPRSPTAPILIHGHPAFVDEEYLKNAAHMLAILRVISMREEDLLSSCEQSRVAHLLRGGVCPLCSSSFETSRHYRLKAYRQPK